MSHGSSGGQRWRTSVGTTPARGVSLKAKRAAWVTIVVALGVAIVWLLLLPRMFGYAKTQIVSIGMTYNDPVFRQSPFAIASANAFDELHQRAETKAQFLSSTYKHEGKLDGSRLLQIKDNLSSLTNKQNLLVYLNLQGGVVEHSESESGVAACFLTVGATPGSLHGGGGETRVFVRELLEKLCDNSAANVTLLLETSDSGPNWRAGILNRDFLTQVKKEVAAVAEKNKKLRVIGAVSDGETAQASGQFNDSRGQTAFSHFVVKGLLGEADGWKRDPGTGKCTPDETRRRSNSAVTLDELFAYVHEQVGAWAKSSRAVKQTVWRIPEADSALELTRIAKLKKQVAEAVAAAKSAGQEKPKDEGKSEEATKSDSSKDKETAEVVKEDSSKKKAATDKPAADKEVSDKKADSDVAAADKTEKKSNDSHADEANRRPAKEEIALRAKYRDELLKLWSQRDVLRDDKQGLAAWIAPREWRRLQLELVHAEQCLRAGDAIDRIDDELKKVKETFGKIAEQIRDLETQRFRPAKEFVSLAMVEAVAVQPSSNSAEPTAEEQKQFTDLMKLAFPIESDSISANATVPKPVPPADSKPADGKPAAAATEPPPHAELKNLVSKFPQYRVRVWQEVLRSATKVTARTKDEGRVAAAEFAKLKGTISLASYLAGATSIPAEIVTMSGVATVAANVSDDAPWTPSLSRACGQAIDLRIRVEQFSAQNWAWMALLPSERTQAETQLVAAERWLQAGQAEFALASLKEAESALVAANAQSNTLRRAALLKASIAAELPDFARWVARRQESSGKESIKSTRKLLRSFAELRKSDEPNTKEAVELTDLRDAVRTQDESWFTLFDVIEQATELFQQTSLDPQVVNSTEKPWLTPQRLNDLTGLTNKLDDSWHKWRSVEREVEALLSEVNPKAEQWSRINEALLVPWIAAKQRAQLLDQLDRIDQAIGRGDAAETGLAAVRGDWQAFWAIMTLRLAGLDSASERALWGEFSKSLSAKKSVEAKSDGDDVSAPLIASAQLGREISRAFAKVAGQADSATTDLTARRDNVDPARGEQLNRGADSTDLPSTDAERWFAKTVLKTHDAFLQDRSTQMSRVARLGGSDSASSWNTLGDRWKSLSPPAAATDWPPVTLEKISDDQLFWSGSDSAEIKLALTVSPRPGAKRREAVLRLLDVDALNVSPQKLAHEDGHELEAGDTPQDVAVTLQKKKGATAADTLITIALLDKETRFPWDIRKLTLRTPQKDQDWRIEFRAKGELADRDHPSAKDRNVPDRNKRADDSAPSRTVLRLPTKSPTDMGSKPLALQPVLIPPPGSKLASVSVKVFEVDESGNAKTTPSGQQVNIAMNRDGLPIPLSLVGGAAPAAPPAATAANPATATAKPAAGHDVSRGWIFEILPDRETKPIRQRIVPRARPPETYFDPKKIDVRFRDGELKFELQRRSDEDERDKGLRPDSVRVALSLPKSLTSISTDNQLIWDFRRGESNRLVARFDEKRLSKMNAETFLVSVNVAGWPRAFPFEVRHDAAPIEFHPTRPVIVSPAAGSVISVGEKLSVEVQIDSERLNSFGLDEPWRLVGELVPDKKIAIPPRPLDIVLFRSLHEAIELVSQGENEWLLTAEVRNHRVEFNTEGLKGRFFVRATATRVGDNETPIGGGESQKVQVAIADPEHQPPTPKLTSSSLEKIPFGTETDWRVQVSAADDEAGIAEIAAGFDNDSDGKLGDMEILKETKQTWLNPLDEVERRVTLKIPAVRLQGKPTGKHKLLVIAKNGVGKVCETPLVVTLEVDQPRGWLLVKVPDLGQKGVVLFINDNKRPEAAKGEILLSLPLGKYKLELANDIITTKRGRAAQVELTKENTKDAPASVTLDPP